LLELALLQENSRIQTMAMIKAITPVNINLNFEALIEFEFNSRIKSGLWWMTTRTAVFFKAVTKAS
jgi:hypothetical protein